MFQLIRVQTFHPRIVSILDRKLLSSYNSPHAKLHHRGVEIRRLASSGELEGGCAATRCDSMVERERLSWTNLEKIWEPSICSSHVSGHRISSNLNSGRHKKQFIEVFPNSRKLERMIAIFQLTTTLLQHSWMLSPSLLVLSGGKISYLRISERCRKRKVKIGRVSSLLYVTIWEDWTDSWIREGPLLYIRSPAKRFRRKQICPHGTLFGSRSELCALDTSLDLCDLPIEDRSCSLLSQHVLVVASPPNQEVEFRGNHHLSLFTNFNQEPWILAMLFESAPALRRNPSSNVVPLQGADEKNWKAGPQRN